MSQKCRGCGFYTLSCQCKKDDNYCGACKRIISDCRCNDHHDHYRYPYTYKDDSDHEKDSPCNRSGSDHGNNSYGGNDDGGNDYSGGNNSGGDDD